MQKGEIFKNLALELYATDGGYYVFDANKVVFLDVDECVFATLSHLREENLTKDELVSRLDQYTEKEVRAALKEIGRLQQRGYLLGNRSHRFSRMDRADFEDKLSNSLAGFTVFVTTQCNLACSYCIYGGHYSRHQELSQTFMTWETAKNMVDFLLMHSRKSEEVLLDWFGGEPLLAFDLIKRSVDYLKASIDPDGPRVNITIASNGTLLTEEVLDFLLAHKVTIQISIDGDKSIHDRERRFRHSDRGSHSVILRNLQRIYDRDPEYFREYVRIKSVITMDALHHAEDGFWKHPLIKILLQEDLTSLLIQEPYYDVEQDGEYFDQLNELGQSLARHAGVETVSELIKNLNWRQRAFFDQTFGQFMEVQAVNIFLFGAEKIGFTKGCLAGYQEGAVKPNGDITICQKASSFVIGNVNHDGWNFDKIWHLHERLYYKWPECTSCFTARFCNLCYEKLDGSDGGWVRSRAQFCRYTRRKYHLIFGYMLQVLDRNPKLWTDMRQLVQSKVDNKVKQLKEERRVREKGGEHWQPHV